MNRETQYNSYINSGFSAAVGCISAATSRNLSRQRGFHRHFDVKGAATAKHPFEAAPNPRCPYNRGVCDERIELRASREQNLIRELDKLRASEMAISAELLEILICPACRAKLELKADGSGLRCVSCHRLYPIRDEIPVLLIDEATIDE